jgi:SAM-dependent methyltransferase
MNNHVLMSDESRNRHCPICGFDQFWKISFIDPENGEIVRRAHGYHWRLCRNCGNATPSVKAARAQLQAYWEKNRIDEDAFAVTEQLWSQRIRESDVWGRRTYDFALPWIKSTGRRFLDIGCGLGGTVARFSSAGWDASGLDPDPNTKTVHDRLGIDVRIARFEEAKLCPPYDVICVAHAIYFLEDPKQSVSRVRDMLSEEGLCVVVYSHLFSALNVGRPAFAHTWYPTRESLVYLFEQEGLKLMDRRVSRGSDLLLFGLGKCRKPHGHPWKALVAHRSQIIRHETIGRAMRGALKFYRKIMRRGHAVSL